MRRLLVIVGSLTILITIPVVRFWHGHATTHETAHRFIRHVYEGRIEQARSMVSAKDRGRVPDGSWDDLRNTEFGEHEGYAFTGALDTYLRNEFPFWLHAWNGDQWTRDDRVLWVADGDVIRISLTVFDQ